MFIKIEEKLVNLSQILNIEILSISETHHIIHIFFIGTERNITITKRSKKEALAILNAIAEACEKFSTK